MALDLNLILGDQVEEPQSVDPVPETEPQVPRLNLSTILQDQEAIDNTAIDTMATGDSKKAAEINAIAKGLNEPIGMVAENFDEKKQQYAEQQTAKVLQNAEHLRQFTADNKEVAPSVKPVLPALAKFEARLAKHEEALRQQRIENNAEFNFSDEPHAWTPDQEEPEDGYFRKLRTEFAAGEYSGELQSQVARVYENARTGKAPLTEALKAEADGKFEELAALEEVYGGTIPYSAGQNAGQMVDMPKNYMGEALSGAAQTSALGAGALAIAGLAGGVTSAVAMAPLAVMAGMGAVYSSTRAIEAGLAYKDMLDSGTPKEEAAVIAGTVGTINGLVEALGDMVLGAIGGKAAGLATKTFVRNALHQAVVKQSMGQALKSVAKGYAGGISTEVTTEVFQEAVNIFGEEFAKRYNGGEAITLDEIRDRLTEIAVTTFQGSLVLGAIGAGPVLTHQIHRVHAARNRQQMFSDLAADMKGNEAVQTAPEVVGAAVQHVADRSQASNIYIDGYAFMQAMQANNISIEDVRKVAPEIADQIENAARTGGDVVIPTGDYAVKIAPTDMGEALSMHVRTEEGQLSAAEAVQVDRVVKGMVHDAVNDPESLQQQVNEKLDEEYKEEAKKLEERYRAEFEKYPKFKKAEARMQAKYGATVATLMAKRAGIAPSELQNFAPTLVMVDAEQNQAVQTAQVDGQGIREDGAYEQERAGTAEAQAKLNAEIKEWERKIDRIASMPRKPKQDELMLTQTPLVMKLVGAKFRRLYVASHTLDGMFPEHMMPKNSKKNRHPEMTADVIKQIPGALADPVAILKSYNNSYVFILELEADGKTVIVPVMFEAKGFNGKINKLTSNYGKDGFDKYIKDQAELGNLVYINKRKAGDQRPSAGSNSLCDAYNHLPDKDSVLTEEDLVNLQKEYPGYYQTSATPTDPLVTIHNQLMGEQGAGRLSPAESQARLDALRIAKQMRLAGKTPKEIRLATGWERGVDGLWRYEFTDAQWKDGFFEDRYPDETTYMLTDLVDAPELFEAYPELKRYRVRFDMEESNTLGSHRSDEKLIWLNSNRYTGEPKDDADAIRSTLLHEIQHAIQAQEGFVGGGNPRDSMRAYQKLLKAEVQPLYELMRSPEWSLYQNLLRTGTVDEIAAAEKDPVVQNTLALQQKIRNKFSIGKNDKVLESVIDKPHSDNSVVWDWDHETYGYQIYKRLGGEVESRNVQARMNMTEDERRQRLLEETADVAPEEQILLTSSNLRPEGPRGTYAPGTNTISITLNGDLSTFAHEMGHWYLEQIFTLSKRADVDPTIVEDAETIKKELGIPDDWDNLTFDAKRKYHEKFAYLTEIYLATGKAPTKSTESFFARMGAWIADVYRQFVGGIKQQRSEQYAEEFYEDLPEISPELKRVFDRMVASQDMLKQAEAAESLRPLFDTKPEDMDEATWIEMQSQRMVAEAEGAAKINELHAKDEKWYTGARSKLLRKLQREAKEIRDKIRERIETQLRNQDVYIALEIFKTGGKALGLENLKMDPDALKDAGYTVTEIAKLRNLGCVRKGGLTPTQARELLKPFARFKTDKRMIRALINAKPINEAIEEATTEECLRKHSEMFDPVKLDAAVTAALHTEARERMIANELKYLAGMKGMNSRVLNEAARRAAQELVAGTKVGQATVKKYMALEAKASRKAYEALAKGDRKAAAVAKHQQLLYSKCVREAMELEKDVAKLKGLKAKIFQSDKKIGKTRDTGILGVARYILTNHGLGKIRAADMDPTAAMRYVEKLQKYQYELFIAFKGLMERHGYKLNDPGLNAMTVRELRALIGDVEYCWKASRDAKVVKLGDAAKTREEVVTELLQQGQSLGLKEYAPGRGEKVTASERAAHGLLSIAAQLRRVESWCNGMDAGNPNKPFRRYIYDPVAQACAKYRVANAAIQEKLANLVAERRKAWDKTTDIEAPEIGYVFRTKAELIGAVLHTGNQSNKQKLLLGGRGDDKPWARLIEGPDGAVHVDTSAWDAFIQRCYAEGIITKEDMDFVQAVWDLMESEKPLIQKAFYQIYGFYFDEIPATEVQTPWGNYRGGYVPAMTDRYIVAEKGVQEEIERITENEYLSMMPVSRPGFAISRVAGYNKPLSLDIGQLCGHIEKTMRFAHVAPVVQEVAKIINDRDFTDFVNKINPHLMSDLLAPWLKRAYSQRIDDGKTDLLSNLCSKYRSLAGMGIMMGNVVNAIQQVTGVSIALSKVGAAKLAVANKKLILERGALIEKVETLSPFMKARLKDRSFEYESRVKRVTSATGKIFGQRGLVNKVHALDSKAEPVRNWISANAYLLQTAMQIPIDITVWVAAFDEAVAKGMSDHEAALEADSVVRTTQSSFAAEDVAKVETGGAFKRAFLVFYNYFGMQYNLLLERKAEANLKPWYKKYGTMAADFMLIVWIPAVLAKVFELALKGELGGDDEDEWEAIDWIQLILGEPIKNVIAFAPIVGGMINTAGGALAKKGSPLTQAIFGKDPYVGKPMSSPAVDLFDSAIVNGLSDLYKNAQGEEVSRRRITRELLDLTSLITRTPAGALKKPLGYIGNVMDGEESTDNPFYGVLRGK